MQRIFELWQKFKIFLSKNEKLLWGLHSVWALTYGVLLMLFFRGDFGQVRNLVLSLMVLMLLIIAFDRIAARESRTGQEKKGVKTVLNFVMKNLYQILYFFMLPFYWDSTQLDSIHWVFTALVATMAVLSTRNLFFDNWLMARKWSRNGFYAICLFASFHLLLPVLMPFPLHYTLMLAAFLSVMAFFLMHMPEFWKREKSFRWIFLIAVMVSGAVYLLRPLVPPVPYKVVASGVTGEDMTLPDRALPRGARMIAAEDYRRRPLSGYQVISSPGFPHDTFTHVYRHKGLAVAEVPVHRRPLDSQRTLLYSVLPYESVGIDNPAGEWTLVLRTAGGLYLKSHAFVIVE